MVVILCGTGLLSALLPVFKQEQLAVLEHIIHFLPILGKQRPEGNEREGKRREGRGRKEKGGEEKGGQEKRREEKVVIRK